MDSFWRRAAFGGLAGIVVLGAYDQHEITGLKAQLANAKAQLAERKAATPSPLHTEAPPLTTNARTWQDIPDRAAVTVNVDALAVATRAREALWGRTYKRSPTCDNPPDNAAFVECGNEYATAHKRFVDSHPLQGFMAGAAN